jgi:hypothetical protein
MEELKCPHDEAPLEEDDCYDMTIWDNGTVVRYMVGYCSQCGKTFQWKERYQFAGCADIEEA